MHTYDEVLKVESVSAELINKLYTDGSISIEELELNPDSLNPHDKLIITNCLSTSNSALAMVDSSISELKLVHHRTPIFGIKPKNMEQSFLLKLLQDNSIKLQLILGKAGTGKTLVTCASALNQVLEKKTYKKVIFTKPTYLVGGGGGIGTVPGNINEKFNPYLVNYQHIIKELSMEKYFYETLIDREIIEYMPIQLMRGASFQNALVVADEVQSLSIHEMKTLCTRIGSSSKLILMGDLGQRDRQIKKEDTGLYRLATSNKIKKSPLCSTIQLTKNERSELSNLLDEVLSEENM